ncbi:MULTISPECIES: Csu type fimbrial protein [unclassified Cupriavidus]|uniref:Csu type fimbrial protein n=1 Tax=unclassified Cupriavidus TaxID=2640874 RepID=UPI00313E0CFA
MSARQTGLRWLLALICLCGMSGAHAACTATAPSVAFGSYSPVSGNTVDVNGTITINCTGIAVSTRIRACINIGTGSAGTTVSPRIMASGTRQLQFNIYSDSYTTPWGARNTAGFAPIMVDFPVLLGNGTASVNYFARLFANQSSAVAGNYSSTFSGLSAEVTYLDYGVLVPAPDCATLSSPSTPITFTATATVANDCVITANTLDFGTSGVLRTALDANGSLSVRCTLNAPYSIALNAGTGAGATVAARRMTRSGGTQTVGYQLFRNAARTEPWGDGTNGTLTVSGTGTGTAQTVNLYGRVPAQTTPQAGTYQDTVTVTITY